MKFLFLLLLVACSTIQKGGDNTYLYDSKDNYSAADLFEKKSEVVTVFKRDPPTGKLDKLFAKELRDLKRVGIVIFESTVQPTRDGLANHDQIFLSAQGKQLITERFLNVWEEMFPLVVQDVDYIPIKKIKQSKLGKQYGLDQENHIKVKRKSLAGDDIFFLPKGKETTSTTTLNPRGMRDMSFVLVPAGELMKGPKWVEHNKHYVNDLAKELKLDAVLVISSDVIWTASRVDKHSGESIPEEMVINLSTSVLIPLSQYEERLKEVKEAEGRKVSVCFRSYEAKVKVPITITVSDEEKNFETVEREILNPMFKVYSDLTQMTIYQMVEDLRTTF